MTVPAFPRSMLYRDHLKWTIAAMRRDDPDLAFCASLLAQCIKSGGLTDRQLKYAMPIVGRVRLEREMAKRDRRQRMGATAVPLGATIQ